MTSIIVPIYNTAAYLKQCLDSLIAQTVSDWEAILVDDASRDGSADIAREYATKDGRFRLLQQPYNQGQSAARNRGLEIAKGEYVAFLDSDDWWEKDYIEQHLKAIEGYDVAQSGYRRQAPPTISSGQPFRASLHPVGEEKVPKHRWQFTSACMRLYRRSAIEGLRFEEGTYYEDVLWTVDLLLRKPKIRMTKYIGYNYRLNPQSTTSIPHKKDEIRVLRAIMERSLSPVTIYTYLRLKLHFLKEK